LQQYPGDFLCTTMLAISYFNDRQLELAKKYYYEAKEIMNRTKDAEPPFAEWKEMKKNFE